MMKPALRPPMLAPLREALAPGEGVGVSPIGAFLSGTGTVDFDAKKALTTQFTDSAGTTPVTASADKVGRWNDATGHGFDAVQGTPSARLNAILTGTRWTDTGDGVDDNLLSSFLNGSGDMSMFIDVDVPATISALQIVAGSTAAAVTDMFRCGFSTGGAFVAGVGSQSPAVIVDPTNTDYRSRRFIGALVRDATAGRVKLFTAAGEVYDQPGAGVVNTTIPWRLASFNNGGSAAGLFTGGIARVCGAPKALSLADFNLMRAEQLAYNS